MAIEPSDHTGLIQQIVSLEFGGMIEAVTPLTNGYSGYVYQIYITNGPESPLIIKLTPQERDRPIAKETLDQRVSAVRPSQFDAAHLLLQQTGLPLPKVFVSRTPTASIPYFYQALSVLPGVSIAPYLEAHKNDASDNLHALVGTSLGHLHQTVRSYDGWVDQDVPYILPWKDAFFQSLASKLAIAQQLHTTLVDHGALIEQFINWHEKRWHAPTSFVLSEFTGFQGMAVETDGVWKLTGLIDLEDHRFVDQRYVLAGHELALTLGGGHLPEIFWSAYSEQKPIDASYTATKSIFFLYYLLSWLPVISTAVWQGDPAQRTGVIGYFEDSIYELCIAAAS